MDKIERAEALRAIPFAPAIRETHPLEDGGVRLVVELPTKPLQRKLLRLPPTVQKEFELDSFGKEVLSWCDGKNTVSDLLEKFAEEFKVHPHEGEKAILTFLRTLVAKGVLSLALKSGKKKKS